MKKWVLVTLMVAGLTMMFAGVALADAGPHRGDFAPTTDACAGCHRAHRAQAAKLLIMEQTALCYTCHGAGANGARTDVRDGKLYEGNPRVDTGLGLRGGGFENAVMQTDPTAAGPIAGPVTANHTIGEPGTMWGSGPTSTDPFVGKTGIQLECGSCHNPHGISLEDNPDGATPGDSYRILRGNPTDSEPGSPVWVPDEATKVYSTAYETDVNGYTWRSTDHLNSSSQVGVVISQWCSKCHTRYMGTRDDDTAGTGDAIFNYRHNTTDVWAPSCLHCHVAHGTSAMMVSGSTHHDYGATMEWPGEPFGSLDPPDPNNSRLLTVDNRGGCVQCHASP